MLAPAKSLLGLSASLLTLHTAQRMRRSGVGSAEQERARRNLSASIARTAFGRDYGIEARMSYERFRQRVPPQGYARFAPWIERMKQGEADVLWPGRCTYFATSSGVDGPPKHLPVTDAMVRHFRQAGLQAALQYNARVGHAGTFQGRYLYLGGCTRLTPIGQGAWGGDLSGIAQRHLPAWIGQHLVEPGMEISGMTDWTARIRATAENTRQRDITVLAGMPNWLLVLARALLDPGGGQRMAPHLRALWPNLECVMHGGIPLGPFADELRQVVGPKVMLHEIYAASAGVIAAQDTDAVAGLRLITGAGVFFEFVPLAEFDESRLDGLGTKAVPLAGVQTDVDYVLLVTTPAGFCRYALGDIVRFLSTEPPRLVHVGRTQLQLTTFGEQVSEKDLTDALLAVCQRHHWRIVNFHVAPFFTSRTKGQVHGRHEWWVELRPGTVDTPTGPLMAIELDAELQRISGSYRERRASGALESPFLRLVMPGLFDEWLQDAGKWGGAHKMPRCRDDRLVADQLGRLAPFSAH